MNNPDNLKGEREGKRSGGSKARGASIRSSSAKRKVQQQKKQQESLDSGLRRIHEKYFIGDDGDDVFVQFNEMLNDIGALKSCFSRIDMGVIREVTLKTVAKAEEDPPDLSFDSFKMCLDEFVRFLYPIDLRRNHFNSNANNNTLRRQQEDDEYPPPPSPSLNDLLLDYILPFLERASNAKGKSVSEGRSATNTSLETLASYERYSLLFRTLFDRFSTTVRVEYGGAGRYFTPLNIWTKGCLESFLGDYFPGEDWIAAEGEGKRKREELWGGNVQYFRVGEARTEKKRGRNSSNQLGKTERVRERARAEEKEVEIITYNDFLDRAIRQGEGSFDTVALHIMRQNFDRTVAHYGNCPIPPSYLPSGRHETEFRLLSIVSAALSPAGFGTVFTPWDLREVIFEQGTEGSFQSGP